jgi:ParB family chromosome partitioning protein
MANAKAKKKPAKAPKAKRAATPRKPTSRAAASSVGLTAEEVASGAKSSEMTRLEAQIDAAGGQVLAAYREPLGGHWVALAALPIEKVKPTPYQRELSKAHADKLATVIPKVGRFLVPVIAVAEGDGFISPNGMHQLSAMTALGAKTIIALVMPEPEIAFRILALNTEKAHNLKDKALEVIRMARALGQDGTRSETDVAFELETPSLVTIGICYEKNPRFSGGAYNSVVSRCEVFATDPSSRE